MSYDYLQGSPIPQEREYKAWITSAIDDYFWTTRRRVQIAAVSPNTEKIWPADEELFVAGKLVGIQFKRPRMRRSGKDAPDAPRRLHWNFQQPAGQLQLILKFPEIFYCLPTFTNRRYRRVALHHCIFWRPDALHNQAWYDNPDPRVKTPYVELADKCRWGYFIEQIIQCPIGVYRTSRAHRAFLRKLRHELAKAAESDQRKRKKGDDWRVIVLFIETLQNTTE
jgi:hypothetical protein